MEDVIYFSNQIKDELDGACDYLKRAIKMREDSNSNWASTYKSMAEAEESHAKNLFNMFEESYGADSEKDTNMGKAVYALIKDEFECGLAKISRLSDKYQSS